MSDRFAYQLIASLLEQGVDTLCLAPGSRSSPLAAAAAREPRLKKVVHFDERALAFYAHGVAKGAKKPVAILTTSGSATGNLFPAVMEAFHSHVPLIVITADRPAELQACMANQTCDQVKLFGSYVHYFAHIPAAESGLSSAWLSRVVAEAVFHAMLPPAGPVHLNCGLREPFEFASSDTPVSGTVYEAGSVELSEHSAQKWGNLLASYEKGAIVAGHMPPCDQAAIVALAKKLGWPILPDLLSGMRSSHAHAIPYYTDIVKHFPHLKPDCVLHLGDRLVIYPPFKPHVYLMVANHPLRSDPASQVTHRINICPSNFCKAVAPCVPQQKGWLAAWQEASLQIEESLLIPPLSEPGLIRHLHTHLPPAYAIYFSNSMPVRDATRFFFPPDREIFCQRGLSGIDGNIATAVGCAEGVKKPLIAVLGDQAALHDLTALALLKKSRLPVIVLVINNGGGGIFSFLPVAKQRDIFETYQAAAHDLEFSKAAAMFHLPYIRLSAVDALSTALQQEESCLIEFVCCREENVRMHQDIDKKMQEMCAPGSLALARSLS